MLSIRAIADGDEGLLSEFFAAISEDYDLFHPHPLTVDEARRLCTTTTSDGYYVLVGDAEIYGYGMLRGWDEGYEVPSLGIAIHPDHRGEGFGRLMMLFLHAAALERGASQIRLTVYRRNTAAVKLYEHLGYRFSDKDELSLLGTLDLTEPRRGRTPTRR